MEIQNPRRALAVSLKSDSEHLSRVVRDITGSTPTPEGDSLAGITHDLPLKTKYYTATVPLWLDVIDDSSAWASSFCSPEAVEVLSVLGGFLFVFSIPPAQQSSSSPSRVAETIRHVGRVVRDGLGGWGWDGVKLAVGVGAAAATDVDEWDELCAEAGLEFVQVGGGGDGGAERLAQQFGEKSGIARVIEALEANEWDSCGEKDPGSDDDGDGDGHRLPRADDDLTVNEDMVDLSGVVELAQADMETLKSALWSGTGDDRRQDDDGADDMDQVDADDVARVEAMMRKLQAARAAGETMGEAQHRKMAAKAVSEVMREL